MDYSLMLNDPIKALCELAYCVINSEDRNINSANLDSICTGNLNIFIATEGGVGWIGKIIFDIVQSIGEEEFIYFDKNMNILAEDACKHAYHIFRGLCYRVIDMIHDNPWKYYNTKIKNEYLICDADVKNNTINNIMRIISSIFTLQRKYPFEKKAYNSYSIIKENVSFPSYIEYVHHTVKSKGELLVEECFKHLPEYKIEYNVRKHLVPGIEKSRWDFIVYKSNTLIGFIEVDGEQHYKKYSYFNKVHKKGLEFAWEKRVYIDKCKDEYALKTSNRKCLRLLYYKKNHFRQCKKEIINWLK